MPVPSQLYRWVAPSAKNAYTHSGTYWQAAARVRDTNGVAYRQRDGGNTHYEVIEYLCHTQALTGIRQRQ